MKYIFRISGVILLICLILSCTKDKPTPPFITTTIVTEISYKTATSGGNVTNEGGAPVVSRGICWNTTVNPTISDSKTNDGSGPGAFTSNISQLTPNTQYYVRSYATNSEGTYYGNQVSFTTSQIAIPLLTTTEISGITITTAVNGGNITSDGGSSVTDRGVCWSTSINPTTIDPKTSNGAGAGMFTSNITGLSGNTVYYVRAYATNDLGTAYGSQISFKTMTSSVTDIDGNVYYTVTIGTQVWIVENLKTTKYNNNTAIPLVTDNAEWAALSTPAYCWYNNDIGNKEVYGALYNWYTVNRGNLCPAGWHVPTDAEWTILTTYAGGESIAGGKLKETGTTHWNPNTDATNETGFTALPGGFRGNGGVFFDLGYYGGYWWSATEFWHRLIQCRSGNISSLTESNTSGFSVRCIMGDPGPVVLPAVTTSTPSNVTSSGASSGGVIKIDAGASITTRGVCWSTVSNPTTADTKTSDGTGAGSFSSIIEGLAINTVYYLRAYATNSAGTAYGDQLRIKTMTGTVTDIDGNIYYTVTIGSQEWMSENLKVTRYRNGDQIPNVPDYLLWGLLTTGGRCENTYVTNFTEIYGWFYNWYAVVDSRNICPTGWHVPTDAEWTTLTTYLGGESIAGGKLKETGTTHWETPNTGATNESGFTALPGDARTANPGFGMPGNDGSWWTATEYDASNAWNRDMDNFSASVNRVDNTKAIGFSIRCIKDN